MSAHDVKLFGDQIAASRLETRFAQLKASSLLRLAIEDLYPGRIALVSSFGADAAALLHMVAQIDKRTPVVFVDTGQHFPETLAYRDDLVARLGLTNVIVAEPNAETVAQEDPEKFLFMSDPDRCCEIRKVRPLAEAMEGFDAWITGRKGFQTTIRATLPLFEAEGERIKINPLVGWSSSDVLKYIADAGLPRHPLVAKGFPSIGCLPCTSPVKPGEDERAGRWRGRGQGRVRHPCGSARSRIRHLMPLWRREGFVEDKWAFLGDEAPVPEEGAIVVSLKRWLAERESLSARAAPVGVAVEAGADAQAHLSDLTNRPLVALAFDKFADGRSFSYARILRDRRQFRGELRAIGDVLIDEIPLMLRCGFDSFDVTNAPTLHALQAGRLPGSPLHYQPSSAQDEAQEGTRPWLRVTRPSNE